MELISDLSWTLRLVRAAPVCFPPPVQPLCLMGKVMATRRLDYPIEPMDLANMRHNGVRSLAVQCHQCRHEVVMKVDHLPGDLAVPSFGPRMVCTKCGTIGADVRPNWRERGT
jgi:hypothetical protein